MKTKVNVFFYFIPIVHIALIGMFLALYFTAEDFETYSEDVKDISISGSYYAGEKKLRTLELQNKGFSFAFDNDNPLSVDCTSSSRALIQGVSIDESGKAAKVTVLFDDNTSFVFNSISDSLTEIEVKSASNKSSVMFPFYLKDGSKLKNPKNLKILVSPQKNLAYTISLKTGDAYLADDSKLRISLKNGYTKFAIKKQAVFSADPEFFLTLHKDAVISDNDFSKAYQSYVKTVFDSVTGTRYVDTQWRGINSNNLSFTPQVATMFASLKYSRESHNYPLAQVKNTAAAEAFKDFNSSVFYGNIRLSYINEKDLLLQKVSKLEPQLASSNLSFLAEDFMFLVKLDYFNQKKFLTQVTNNIKKLTATNVASPEVASGIILNILNYTKYLEVKPEQYSEQLKMLADLILASIYEYKDGYQIAYNEVYSPVIGMKAAKALIFVGNEFALSNLVRVGQNLFVSASGQARRDGSFSINLADADSRFVGPEDFYNCFQDEGNFTKYKLFQTHDNKQVRIFHASKDFSVTSSTVDFTNDDGQIEKLNRIVIKSMFSKNVGTTYLFAVSGLSSYSHVSMRGYPVWNNDWNFEKYSSGFYFDPNLETFFFKIAQQKDEDEFIIYYK